MLWFGEPWPRPDWRAPICEDDTLRRPTPVGAPCMHCQHPIDEDDRGVLYPGYVDSGPDGEPVMINRQLAGHIECQLRNVLGCYGNLTGGPHTDDDDYRDDALKVQAWVDRGGLGHD